MRIEELLERFVIERVATLRAIDRDERDSATVLEVDHRGRIVGGTIAGMGAADPHPYAAPVDERLDGFPMQRNLRTALAASTLVAILAGCGSSGDSDAEIEARIAAQLAEGGLDDKAAECVAGVLIDEIGADEIKDIDLSASEPGGRLDDEIASAAIKAEARCSIDTSQLGG